MVSFTSLCTLTYRYRPREDAKQAHARTIVYRSIAPPILRENNLRLFVFEKEQERLPA